MSMSQTRLIVSSLLLCYFGNLTNELRAALLAYCHINILTNFISRGHITLLQSSLTRAPISGL